MRADGVAMPARLTGRRYACFFRRDEARIDAPYGISPAGRRLRRRYVNARDKRAFEIEAGNRGMLVAMINVLSARLPRGLFLGAGGKWRCSAS